MKNPSETGPGKALRTAIVGAGPGCMAIMDVILGEQLRQLPLMLVGVADVNPRAPALERARAAGIFTTPDFRDLLALPGLNLLIELIGDDAVVRDIERQKPKHVRLMDHTVARLFWDMIRLDHEKRQAEKRYKDLFDLAREGMALIDAEGRIRECNFSLARMMGYSKAELEKKGLHELAENESAKILRCHLGDLMILGFVSVEMDFVCKTGEPIPVEAGIDWLPDERLFRVMVRDITTQRKLEESRKVYSERLEEEVAQRTERLRASEEEARRQKRTAEGIIYGSPIPMFIIDKGHRITYWNKACEKVTGFTSDEMIGTRRQWEPFYPHPRPLLADLIIDGDKAAIEALYQDKKLGRSQLVEGAFEAEDFFPHLGEGGTHLYMKVASIRDDGGKVEGAIIIYQDFTERVRMTEEIRRRENFVQNLIMNSIDGIIATGPGGKITIFNRGAAEILGYAPEEIIDELSYPDILSPDTAQAVRESFYGDRHGPPGKIIHMETALLGKSRERIPVRLSGTLLHEGGEEVGSVVFIQDLRETQRLQKEKERAERMAAVGETVAGLAHYIKNILSGLKGGAYVIDSALAKNDIGLTKQGWGMVERNIDQIASIVQDMLVYSGEGRPAYEGVDPNSLVRDVVALMSERARISGVSLLTDLAPDLGEVRMDRMAIHRCLLDLVSNAVDACVLEGILSGRGVVTVRTDRPQGWGVRFQVSDNGKGMDEATQRRLFSDFFTTKGYKGTGLGLPVTHKIVKDHRGSLSFESELGRGTTFTLMLPGAGNEMPAD